MKKSILLVIMLGLFQFSCGHVNIDPPQGFVKLKKTDTVLKLYAADASVMRVTYRENQKNGNAAFWKELLKRELIKFQGYKLLNEEKSGKNVFIMKFHTPYRYKDFIYSVAVLASDDDLYIVEMGTKKENFKKHEAAFLSMVKKVKSEL